MKKSFQRSAPSSVGAEAPAALGLDNASMTDVIQALADGRVDATTLTKGYPRLSSDRLSARTTCTAWPCARSARALTWRRRSAARFRTRSCVRL